MKISKRQLRRIIKEEKALLMEEPSDYYRDYKAGTITRQEYEALVRQYNEREGSYSYRPRRPRKTVKVGLEATRERLDVIRRVRGAKDSKFLLSISNQLSSGRDLTSKQNAIIRKIVAKHEPESVSLFESIKRVNEQSVIDKTVPDHFDSGENIDVYDYQTKHFDICASAVKLFKSELSGAKFPIAEDAISEAAKISDEIFAIEKRVVRKGFSTFEECDEAKELHDEFKDLIKEILSEDYADKIDFMKMHVKEITKREE